MHEDDAQGSLFGGDAFQPPSRRPREPERRTFDEPASETSRGAPAPWAPGEIGVPPEQIEAPPEHIEARPAAEFEAPPVDAATWAPPDEAPPANTDPWAPAEAPLGDLAPPEEGVDPSSVRVSRAPLAGPTLDDAVSRAWEGLVAGVPAPCPVCHGEIEPALGGSLQGYCPSCHVTLD
jgi:hypothetical protein